MKVSAAEKAVAIVGIGAILPDAPNAPRFWQNIRDGVYSITEVDKDRWDAALYYDADPKAPDKTYSKIGGWVREWEWDPLKWRLPIPPRVSQGMDLTQKWGVVTAREALQDYGYPDRPLNPERTAVIYGNAMGGDTHLYSAARIFFPEFAEELARSSGFAALPAEVRKAIIEQMYEGIGAKMPPITEDTMPGELANILAGRIAALYDFRGPNYVADAACASALAAITAAISGLNDHHYDAVLTGGIDANMGPSTFVKFCKIGALSATGSRPYAEGADGFVMGEGGVTFLMKRLADAERDGDRIYAVVRSIGASSDGKGKGITAPNPVGQKLCVRRAWESAGVVPAPGDLIEGHGTSTSVGDAAELESLAEVLSGFGLGRGSLALGSVKSNIGHLKGGAGAAGILKAALCLKEHQIAPSLNFVRPNPHIDFAQAPFTVNTALRDWDVAPGQVRRAGVSAFGFGGTNFHAVLEEYVPGRLAGERKPRVTVPGAVEEAAPKRNLKVPLRGALVLGAELEAALVARAEAARKAAEAGQAPEPAPPMESDLRAPLRLAVDYGDAAELADKLGRALKAFEENQPARWKALRPKGIYYGKGPAPKVAFLFTGQGSQYVNMLRTLRETEPVVTEVFAEADRTMTPLIGRSLTSCIYLDESDEAALAEAENSLKQTAITQPAVLATETALARLIGAYGIAPDMVMGHSLGEYGALVAAGAITFENALRAVSARGNEMTKCAMEDNGLMAAAFGPIGEIQKVLETVDDYVVIANINSTKEAVIGGSTTGVEKAVQALKEAGYVARVLQVSHAFHTNIVAPAGESLARILGTMNIQPPVIPIVTNVTGEFYPMGPGVVPEMIDLLGRQVSSPVQFIKGLNTLYDAGARVFVEMGPKRILYGFVEDVLGDREGVLSLFTNHPRIGEAASLNLALCGLYAAGLGVGQVPAVEPAQAVISAPAAVAPLRAEAPVMAPETPRTPPAVQPAAETGRIMELGRLFAEFLDRGMAIHGGAGKAQEAPVDVCITGAALGLPGVDGVFSDENVERMLRGDVFIRPVPEELRRQMVEKNITRLVKSEGGEGRFEYIQSTADVIKLAARSKEFDIVRDFGFPEDRMAALDRVTKLAIGAGIDALRDAGIPLVMRYKTTTKGTKLPDRWVLPDDIRDDTGVLFTSAFPGYDSYAEIMADFYQDRERRTRLAELETLRAGAGAGEALSGELDRRIAALKKEIEEKTYHFDRRFLFRVLSMGHSQFAEYIGARGPNTSTNGACSSGTQAVGIASDWIRTGRCRRVIVISADDITSDNLFGWFGSGFLASGSAATGEKVEEEAIPFDRRRHGLIVGMGASAIILESAEAARERGIRPICQVLGSVVANSAFHGSRLDVNHIRHVMEKLISQVERDHGLDRYQIAPEMVFVSHETYTPARGGSASAEVFALRHCFKEATDRILIANTKGATGHPMAVGIEDVVSAKILETGIVPPVPNFKEVDPELGNLNLSKGGGYPVRYILRLGAGFGSQISITMMRWIPTPDGRRPAPGALGYNTRIENPAAWTGWLKRLSGYDAPEIEIVKRTLRIRDQGPTAYRENGNGYAPPAAAPAPAAVPPASATAQAQAAAAVPAAAPAVTPGDAVQQQVLRIIAEKTGYPTDMLDLDLDLEADLGIDTVKQAEMFAAIREAYDIPREDDLKLRDFPTLGHVVGFVYDRKPDLAAARAAAPAAVPAATALPAPAPGDGVREKVLGIIAEKTGYPIDMLDLDLDLEADLGIDTVKQAEMFAAIREAYDIPREDDLKLRDFPTLAHVIGFVYDRKPGLRQGEGGAAAPSAPETAAPAAVQTVAGSMEAANAVARRVPVPQLRPSLALCKPTGVSLGAGSRVVIMPDQGGIARALVAKLEKMGVETLLIEEAPGVDELGAQLERWAAAGPVQGVYWLPALDCPKPVAEMNAAEWREATRVRAKLLFAAMKTLYAGIGAPGTFLVTATRLGGMHGYDEAGAFDPLGGAVTGFAKAFKREKGEATVKAVDFEPSRKTSALADLLIGETLGDPGAVEIGYRDGRRYAIGLSERPAADGGGLTLDKDTVFVVTGAAGSIVSAITADLAGTSGGTFYLLDMTPEPDPADGDLARLRSDREGLKRDIFERLKAGGERVTPVMVDRELAALERRAAALDAIRAVQGSGGTAHYRSLDLMDTEAVGRVMEEIRQSHGRVDVLLHAAGLEISRAIPDKAQEEFDRVFDVKSAGWFHLLSGAGDMPLRAAVVFSSVAGRFGNAGQTDYSSANDLLCKCVSHFRSSRPDSFGIAIDWTAWSGIGMASRGSIPTIMKQAGIDMLAPEAGIPVVRRELTGGTRGEVVIGQRLGIMVTEFDPEGGLDVDAEGALAPLLAGRGVMIGEVKGMGLYSGLTVETTLDPAQQPFLYDHQIDGTPVLPGVMGIEGMAEAARLLFPDLFIGGVEEVTFLAPFKFYRNQPRTVTLSARYAVDGEDVVADCSLVGARRLHGQTEPEVTTHFTGKVRLVAKAPAGKKKQEVPGAEGATGAEAASIYRVYFHGPAYQVIDSAWKSGEEIVGRFAGSLPPNHLPAELPLVVAPRFVELCFQTASLLGLAGEARLGLPYGFEKLEIVSALESAPGAGLLAVVRRNPEGAYDAEVVDDKGKVYMVLRGYRTMDLPGTVEEEALLAIRKALKADG